VLWCRDTTENARTVDKAEAKPETPEPCKGNGRECPNRGFKRRQSRERPSSA